jgi:hypothetical protein
MPAPDVKRSAKDSGKRQASSQRKQPSAKFTKGQLYVLKLIPLILGVAAITSWLIVQMLN